MMPIRLRILFILYFLLHSPFLRAGEIPEYYADSIYKKLYRMAELNPPRQPIVSEVGTEQVVFFELDKNGLVMHRGIGGGFPDSALASSAHRLINLAAPFSGIPPKIADAFTIIRLSVTVSINDSRAISVKEVRAVGGYKYVEF